MTTPRLFLLSPATVFAARVNMPSGITYPLDEVTFDTVTTGIIGDVLNGMTIWFGSAAGLDDYGRQRVRGDGSGSTIQIGRSSRGTRDGEVDLVDNAYITVVWCYRPWAKTAYIEVDGSNNAIVHKDAEVALGTNTSQTPPVANIGPGVAGTIDSVTGKLRVAFPYDTASFATADGATITGYSWGLPPGATLVAGYTVGDNNIEVDFAPGFYWLSLTVTDSNGKTHRARCPVFARDPANDPSIEGFQIESHTVGWAGQRVSVRILEDLPASTYPDGTLAMIWEGEPGVDPRAHMRFIGWHQTDDATIAASRSATLRDVRLNLVDVAGRLATLPGFPQVVERNDTPTTWMEMATPNLDKYLHYLLHWHSTALDLADWTWTGTGATYAFAALQSDGQSLWAQLEQRARAYTPDRHITCNKLGQLAIYPDPIVAESAYRTALQVQATLDASDWSDIRYTHQRPPRVHWLWGEAIVADATPAVDADGEYVIDTVFCVAPGLAPGQGEMEETAGERLAVDQAALNSVMGHAYARKNAPQGYFNITLPESTNASPPWRFIEPAKLDWVQLTIEAAYAAQRGLSFTAARGLVREMTIRYDYTRTGLIRTTELTWERETSGAPAVTYVPSEATPVDGGDDFGTDPDPVYVPDYGLTTGVQNMVVVATNGKLYRTSDFQSGTPTWNMADLTANFADGVDSWIVDPFSPLYRSLGSQVNSFAVNESGIYKIVDMFGTPSVTTLHSFSGESGGEADRVIYASFGRYQAVEAQNPWLICLNYYRGRTGHADGTYAMYSTDAGATWVEVLINSLALSGSATRQLGLWLSPRTPGFALAEAYNNTDYAPTAYTAWYKTNDWGATWSLETARNIKSVFGTVNIYPVGPIHVPWHDNADELLVYHATEKYNGLNNIDRRIVRVQGTTITDISPNDGSILYGTHAGGSNGVVIGPFEIRAHDNNRQYLLAALLGSHTSGSGTRRFAVSSDAGNTWTILLQSTFYQAAFAGDTQQTIFAWGNNNNLYYSTDFGANFALRGGGLATANGGVAIGTIIGIAGG